MDTLAALAAEETFVKGFLITRCKVSQEAVAVMQKQNPDCFKEILQFLLKATLGLKLPPNMVNSTVADRVVGDRCMSDGDRIALLKTVIKPDGSMDWRNGTYEFKWDNEDDRATHVVHSPTGHSAPSTKIIAPRRHGPSSSIFRIFEQRR